LLLIPKNQQALISVSFNLTNMKKEDPVLTLFFNEPTKQWHFENILRSADISRPQASQWLRKLTKEGIIQRIKPRGKMPFFIADHQNPAYQTRKKLFALKTLEKTGFLSHLAGLKKAKTVILFGSLSRWDWAKDSDIDLFFYGNTEGFDQGRFRGSLHREIEIFACKDQKELKKMPAALLRNIIEGYLIKGTLDFIEVNHAQ